MPERAQTYTERDTMLYALGIGIGHDTTDPGQLGFVYERGLKAVPTMAVVLGETMDWVHDPGLGIDVSQCLHGEERVILHRPLAPEGRVVGQTRITGLADKGAGRGALVHSRKDLRDADTGELIATTLRTAFARADGGFGGVHGETPVPLPPVPDRAPDMACDLPTVPQAALIYRLSGDRMPLHADPALARAAGFDRPILHGLCSLGMACHAILRLVCGHDPARIAEIGCRFSAPVFPGETLRVELWREGQAVRFRALVVERGVVAMTHGHATLRG
ncbi:3-alpha,7-alpha,12-alpha-trihydroxy-5-beta-cholest-24-enoyl-CoA hydratase [Paracoccus sp. YIM 132242]|uniref:3-alpha,7-alpha, 12-alpha-trihydroxy-5-beta-cholest-24-enoyl-CoA hydratase n=1 Tax=Paracoccus lichenicola TaxID=2665644 RepID=A0A6L6HRB3_9RHOB|nr:3-alpha,7-alpha,12-alpha-trihydroxy-5-beta-cholest-24-enoyl-CoA hydratase [Paracoccus lichenicola]